MTLDTTKWATGSDGDLIPQPVVASTAVNTTDRYLELQLASGGILASQSDADLTEIWFATAGHTKGLPFDSISNLVRRALTRKSHGRDQADARRWFKEPLHSSGIIYNDLIAITAKPYLRNYNLLLDMRLPREDGIYFGALSCPYFFAIFYDNDGTGVHSVEIATPYHWQDLDMAELIFALTRFYSGGGTTARDLLAEDDLYAYSELMADPLRQVWLSYWREVDTTIGGAIAEMLSEGGALARWGIFESGAFTFKFSLLHLDIAALHSTTYDLDAGVGLFLVAPCTMRTAGELLVNRLTTQWGSMSVLADASGPWTGDLHPSWSMSSPGSTINKENELTIEDAASIATRGLVPIPVAARHVFYPEHASAAAVRFGYLHDNRRVIGWSMGPLHFDFNVGDVVPITNAQFGLSAVRFLITSKVYRWNALQADITAVEYLDDYSLAPDDPSLADNLLCWLDANEGITLSGSDVTVWADQSGNGNDAVTLARGTAVNPTIAPNEQNNLDAVDFGDGDTGADHRGLDMNGMTAGEGDWTIIAVAKIESNVDVDRYDLFHSESTAGEELRIGVNDEHYCFEFSSEQQGADTFATGWQVLVYRFAKTDAYFNSGAIWKELDNKLATVYGTGGSTEKASLANDTSLGCNKGGTGNSWWGMIGEFMIFDRGLLPHEIRGLVKYARDRWAI